MGRQGQPEMEKYRGGWFFDTPEHPELWCHPVGSCSSKPSEGASLMVFLTWWGLVELLEEMGMVRAEESHVWGKRRGGWEPT